MSGLITVTRDALNYTTSYACQQLVEGNNLNAIDTVFFYDLAYNGDFNTTLEGIKESILNQVAIKFGLDDGSSCLNAPVGSLWLVSIATGTYDIDSYFPKCLDLAANATESCVVVRGEMTALPVGTSTDNSFIVTAIAQALRSGAVTKGTSHRVAFLGTTLDQTALGNKGTTGDSIASIGSQPQSDDSGRKTITVLGGVFIAGFCFVLMGVTYFLYQRRKRYMTAREVELAISKSESMADNEAHTLQQDAMSDDMADGNDTAHSATGSNGSQAPDLSQSLRNEMMGVHARHTDFVNTSIPRSMDDISDAGSGSDADSWAQTDGTIGSLELQLDPITAEV